MGGEERKKDTEPQIPLVAHPLVCECVLDNSIE